MDDLTKYCINSLLNYTGVCSATPRIDPNTGNG